MRLLVVGTINKYPPPGPDWEVVHVDASDRGIYDSELKQHVRVEVVADMRAMPFPAGYADRIQSWHALEHVNRKGGEDTLREFRRVLTPGGEIDLRVPNLAVLPACESVEEWLPLTYGDQFEMRDGELNVHRWGYTPDSLLELLDRTGFDGEVQDTEPHELYIRARRRT